jgi:FixJ family two-component response regulator
MKHDAPIIYVLDDDYRVREALSGLFLSAGHPVEVFASAAEYLVFKKPDSPGCLVLDLELPGMSGLDLQREIAGPDAPPIIFLTGHGGVPSSVRAMKAGASDSAGRHWARKCGRQRSELAGRAGGLRLGRLASRWMFSRSASSSIW